MSTLFWPGYYITLTQESLATLESHNAPSMFAGECIRATNRWTVTLALKRFKGSKRVKGKEEGGGGRENSYYGDYDITRGLRALPQWEFCMRGGEGKQWS